MLIVKNAELVQFDPPSVTPGMDIIIQGTKVLKTGKGLAGDYPGAEVIDASGKFVWPGFVCSHNHFYSGLSRGVLAEIAPSTDFVGQLQNLWWRLDRAIDEDILLYSGLVCSLEAIKAGTTAVIDHHSSQTFIKGSLKVLQEAFERTGLRGITCFETTDRNGRARMIEGAEETIAFTKKLAALRDKEENLVQGLIGGHAPFTLSDEALELLAGGVRETGKGLHLHVAEDRFDASHSHAVYGKDLIKRLDDAGLIGPETVIAHGIFLTDDEIDIVNSRDAFLVHNARSNMNNNVGYNSRLPRFSNAALGTDGIGSNMFEEFKVAYFKHKDAGGTMWPGDFLKLLHSGNTLLERNFTGKFGRIAEGYKADLVISDYRSPTPFVGDNIAGHLAFGLGSDCVETVIINGKTVYKNKQFPMDVAEIYSGAEKAAKRLWENMDNLD